MAHDQLRHDEPIWIPWSSFVAEDGVKRNFRWHRSSGILLVVLFLSLLPFREIRFGHLLPPPAVENQFIRQIASVARNDRGSQQALRGGPTLLMLPHTYEHASDSTPPTSAASRARARGSSAQRGDPPKAGAALSGRRLHGPCLTARTPGLRSTLVAQRVATVRSAP